jgi:hypothetical protein
MKTMTHRFLVILALLLLAGVDGFGQKINVPTPQGATAPAVQAQAPKTAAGNTQTAAPAAGKQDDATPPLVVPPGFKYEARGRRDPFVNPVPKPVAAKAAVAVVRPPGLKGVLAAEIQVSGVVLGKDPTMTRAVLSAGGNTYLVKKGDVLFDAVVKDIQKDRVTFEMKEPDKDGKLLGREVVRRVNPAP